MWVQAPYCCMQLEKASVTTLHSVFESASHLQNAAE